VYGFPVFIDPMFWIFMGLMILCYGLHGALVVAAFIVVHELGHALAAQRRGGTQISIELQ